MPLLEKAAARDDKQNYHWWLMFAWQYLKIYSIDEKERNITTEMKDFSITHFLMAIWLYHIANGIQFDIDKMGFLPSMK